MAAMKNAVEAGYVVSGQDNGHIGAADDSSYAVGHSEKVIDFGWRSLHEVAVAAKGVIVFYYGRQQSFSLFNGCSTGGRQALALAQRFPEDYDGISAGTPANYWPELNALHAQFGRSLLEHPDHWVSQEKLLMVQNAVHAACGAIDQIIDDPGACRFDVAKLSCTASQHDGCLTAGEVAGIKERFSDLVDEDGTLIYPSATQGLESALGSLWFGTSREGRFYSGGTWRYPEKFFADYVHARKTWTVREFDWKTDLNAARRGVIGISVAAENPDLSAFAKRGGKLIQWHGWHDMGIPARNSIRYYESVVKRMGADAVGRFYRLFMGTGVNHCGGGPAPDVIGAVSGRPPPRRDAEHDVMEALVKWIDEGKAPGQIIATKYADDVVVSQRPWCAYPQVARWNGHGDRTKATSYRCSASRGRR